MEFDDTWIPERLLDCLKSIEMGSKLETLSEGKIEQELVLVPFASQLRLTLEDS